MFLEQLVNNFEVLNELTHIILDEVHERDIDSDFIMLSIKHLLGVYPKLRVVIMSATLQSKMFTKYFSTEEVLSCLDKEFYPALDPVIKLENAWLIDADKNPWEGLVIDEKEVRGEPVQDTWNSP